MRNSFGDRHYLVKIKVSTHGCVDTQGRMGQKSLSMDGNTLFSLAGNSMVKPIGKDCLGVHCALRVKRRRRGHYPGSAPLLFFSVTRNENQ